MQNNIGCKSNELMTIRCYTRTQLMPVQIKPPDFSDKDNFTYEGIWKSEELRPGIWVSIMDFKPVETITFKYQKHKPLIDLGFILEGDISNSFQSRSADITTIDSNSGMGGVLFAPEAEGTVEIKASKKMQAVHVHIEPELLHSLMQGELGNISTDLKKIVEGSKQESFMYRGVMEPAVSIVAHHLLSPPMHGVPKRMFLEGKALELIAMQIGWANSREKKNGKTIALSPSETEKLYAVKEMLIENISNPPTLSELSSQFCISINKLNSGFQEIFGATVFGFFNEFRMQQAMLLFQKGDMNVSEIAWTIGYTNVSHFSAAFKKRFNILPKTCLTMCRQRKFSI